MSTDKMRLIIRDCRVDLSIGMYEAEMQETQPVVINIECGVLLTQRYDDIALRDKVLYIDYEPFYNFVQHELPKMGHIYLLESAAEQIVTFCFRDARVEDVRVRVEKTAIFPHAASAGIELYRMRS
jgi:dihydroneopterin aldolase